MEYIVNKYKQLLIEENKKQNLVSRKTGEQELDKHILDSRMILDFAYINGKVIDIGSGAGFPGLILAMCCPDSYFTLIESDLKKSTFLVQIKESLSLTNVNIIRDRAEIIGQDSKFREKFDFCTSRAVAAMNIMVEYALPLLKVGGKAFMWKGSNYQEEIREAENALNILGGKVVDVYLYSLMEERDRAIVVIEKQKVTPEKYPRRVGIPSKRPL